MPECRLRLVAGQSRHCETEASIPLDAIRRPRHTPIPKLKTALKCRSCGTWRQKPPVRTLKP
jgi:hypothetical protein